MPPVTRCSHAVLCAPQVYPGAIHNGVLFVSEKNNYPEIPDSSPINVYALKLDTQDTIWTAEVAGNIYNGPVYDDGLVYVGTEKGWFKAFDASDGTERWAFEALDPDGWNTGSFSRFQTRPLIVGDAVIATTSGYDGKAHAWSKKTGVELWTFQMANPASGG